MTANATAKINMGGAGGANPSPTPPCPPQRRGVPEAGGASLTTIEQDTRAYANARNYLSELIGALTDELEAAKRRRLPGIKIAVASAADARSRLKAAIESAPDLFRKPKTLTIAGIRVGYQLDKGHIEIDDAKMVVRLIRKHLPDQAETLIKVEETPIKPALKNLSVAELKKNGVRSTDAGDVVIIKPTDGEVEKLVDALLKEAREDES